MRRRHSRDQWLAWLSEQRRSNLTVSEFCQRNGISEKSFYVWRKKLAGGSNSPKDSLSATFVPVSVKDSPKVEIELPCGATVRVADDGVVLRRVLKVLLETGVAS